MDRAPRGESGRRAKRIVLIEDHAILRDGLRALLDLEEDFDVVGEAGSAGEGRLISRQLQPDIVITDLALPGASALTVVADLKALDSAPRVLILTAHCTDEYVRAALEAGADGYISKDASRHELIRGVRTVLDGRQYFSDAVAQRVVSGFLGRDLNRGVDEQTRLTDRERQVLILIAMAHSSKHIANALDVSVKTVEKHRSNLMRKLGLHNTAAVTLYAIRNNMVAIDATEFETSQPEAFRENERGLG